LRQKKKVETTPTKPSEGGADIPKVEAPKTETPKDTDVLDDDNTTSKSRVNEMEKNNQQNIDLIVEKIHEIGQKEPTGRRYRIRYGKLREACAQHFEGMSLLLKTMKQQGLIDYEGIIVMADNAIVTLL